MTTELESTSETPPNAVVSMGYSRVSNTCFNESSCVESRPAAGASVSTYTAMCCPTTRTFAATFLIVLQARLPQTLKTRSEPTAGGARAGAAGAGAAARGDERIAARPRHLPHGLVERDGDLGARGGRRGAPQRRDRRGRGRSALEPER